MSSDVVRGERDGGGASTAAAAEELSEPRKNTALNEQSSGGDSFRPRTTFHYTDFFKAYHGKKRGIGPSKEFLYFARKLCRDAGLQRLSAFDPICRETLMKDYMLRATHAMEASLQKDSNFGALFSPCKEQIEKYAEVLEKELPKDSDDFFKACAAFEKAKMKIAAQSGVLGLKPGFLDWWHSFLQRRLVLVCMWKQEQVKDDEEAGRTWWIEFLATGSKCYWEQEKFLQGEKK